MYFKIRFSYIVASGQLVEVAIYWLVMEQANVWPFALLPSWLVCKR